MAQWLSHLDPGGDVHLEVKLVERLTLEHGFSWKAHAIGMGVVQITFEECFATHLTCDDTLWIWDYITLHKGEIIVSTSAGARLIRRPNPNQPTSQSKLAELFGGITGWSTATSMMGQTVSFVVEKAPEVAKAAADMYGCPCRFFDDVWNQFISTGEFSEPCIWIGSVTDFRMWTLMSLAGVRHLMASPPCPPWCSMASQLGLAAEDGQLMGHLFRKARDLGAASICTENARGFKSHIHSRTVFDFAESLGFSCVQDQTDNCTGVLPLNRCRWLATFVAHDIRLKYVSITCAHKAMDITLPSNPFLGGMRGCDALLRDIPDDDLKELLPTKEAINVMSDPKLVPNWWGKGINLSNDDAVLKSRITKPENLMTCLVASYGKQHKFGFEYLEQRGLCVMLTSSSAGPRFFSPWEQAACLGLPADVKLPESIELAWHVLGNAISVAHALLQLTRLHILLNEGSPFPPSTSALPVLCRMMQRKGIHLSGKKQIFRDGCRVLVDAKNDRVDNPSTIVSVPLAPAIDAHVVDCVLPDQPPCKFAKTDHVITPTVPFVAIENDDAAPKKQQADDGVQFMTVPSNAQVEKMVCDTIQSHVRDEYGITVMPFVISCMTYCWVHIGWIGDDATVWQMIRTVWPFAQCKWIKKLMCCNKEIGFDMCPESLPFRIINFQPTMVLIGVQLPFPGGNRVFEVNITTTVGRIIMESALLLNVNKDSLSMMSHGVILDGNSFILGIDDLEDLEIQWKPFVSIPRLPMIMDQSFNPTLNDIVVGCNDDEGVRLAVVHPVWGTIRTAYVSKQITIHEAVKILLPDWPIQARFLVGVDGKVIESTVLVKWVCWGKKLVIEGCGNKPCPPLEVEIIKDTPGHQKPMITEDPIALPCSRYIRSPFKIQAEWVKFQGDESLMSIGAAFMSKCQSLQAMSVTINGKGVDPKMLARYTHEATIVAFRVLPLVGGAKDEIQLVLSKTLTSRGVSEDSVDARVKQILADIPSDQIRPHLKEPDFQFWSSLKKLANEHKVRLITNGELKAHQKSQRQDKPKSSDAKQAKGTGKGKRTKSDPPQVDLSRVSLDLSYVTAGEESGIKVIPKEDFAADHDGIALMAMQDAVGFLPAKKISTGPLAIFAVVGNDTSSSKVVMMPATTHEGNPILLPVVIFNFGDIEVRMKEPESKVTTQQVDTQVIEITIRRDLTSEWKATRDALQYLGKTVGSLAEGALVAHWGFKNYNGNKAQVQFDKASYTHGFVRAKAEHVDAILKVSGKGGIFLVPKDSNHKPDSMFTVVPTGTDKLDQMVAHAQRCPKALGVVELSSGYAFRCRREHAHTVRKELAPSALWTEEGQARSGDQLWVLKHVQVHTGPSQLSLALQEAGWDAVALKPLGPSTWSIAAAKAPPKPHIPLDGSFTIAVPAYKPSRRDFGLRATPIMGYPSKSSGVPTVVCDDEEMGSAATSSTRLQEIKGEMSEQIEKLVQERFKETTSRIDELTSHIEQQNEARITFEAKTAETLTSVQEHQKNSDVRMNNIENTVSGISSSVVSQMNSMLQTMQSALIGRIDALEGGETAKRARKDGSI